MMNPVFQLQSVKAYQMVSPVLEKGKGNCKQNRDKLTCSFGAREWGRGKGNSWEKKDKTNPNILDHRLD